MEKKEFFEKKIGKKYKKNLEKEILEK